MRQLLSIIKSSIFLLSIVALLLGAAVSSTIWALRLSSQVTIMSANAAATAVRHREDIARAVARTRAQARLRRVVAAIPAVGAVAIFYFEEQDFQKWQEENPGGTPGEYACENARLSAELVDDVLSDLPEGLRPDPERVLSWMPECPDRDLPTETFEAN